MGVRKQQNVNPWTNKSTVSSTGTRGYRYMQEGELKAVNETDLLRGGREGETYFSKDQYKSGISAQERLALPSKPTLRVEFEIQNNPKLQINGNKVAPAYNMPGKGSEFMTTDPVRVKIINVQPIK